MRARTSVYLDEHLKERLRRLVPPRRISRFINEAVAEKVERLERTAVEQAMKEGYLATAEERAELSADWESVDIGPCAS